jgi:hypothetical protein
MQEPWSQEPTMKDRVAQWSENTVLTLTIFKELVLGVVHLFLDSAAKKPPYG